ncbi:Leucine rich repeat-containing protein [Alkalispirochaeta americana]|uniref:Leucine rich repeat-containing protein n=1 Tax=Alkalispirochaeta americana TaxID=159291 RepID=A0A1N6PQG9_9SPIO|nr:leucine-rich repeat domain-containing protein [Alkalispirochaeta americana]SIQ06422.1 Leucine rich repeat-containing protein [Alkalispirochaeta americana]
MLTLIRCLKGCLVASLICLAACSALLSPFEKSEGDRPPATRGGTGATGTLIITFPVGAATVLPPGVSPEDLLFNLTLTPVETDDPAQESIEGVGFSASGISLPGIPEGTWNISLRGYFPEDTPLEGVTPQVYAFGASSADPVAIYAGEPTYWQAQLRALQEATGSVLIKLTWNPELFPEVLRVTNYLDDDSNPSPSLQRLIPGGTPEDPVYIDDADANIDIAFHAENGTLTYHQEDLQSGFYRIVITLERHDADTNETFSVGTYRDVIHIYDSLRSEKKDLDITDRIGTPPSKPEDLQVSPVSFNETEGEWTVGLSWARSVTAEGYRVYRSENEGDFELLAGAEELPRTTSSFNTTQSTSINSYQYRLVARNTYGNAQPLDSPAVPGDLQATDGDFTFLVYPDRLVLLAYTGAPSVDVVIPGALEVNGENRPVTKIGPGAFKNKEITERLTIPDSITEIGAEAFENNTFTGDLEIPDSVVTIGDNAFKNAGFDGSYLILGTTESNLETIGSSAFSNNAFAGNLTIPDSVTSIGNLAFGSAGFDGTLTLETTKSNLETIGSSAFSNNAFAGNLIIPDSVTSIGNLAFGSAGFNGGTLTLGTVDSNLETIGSWAFEVNAFTGDLTIPDSVVTIGSRAFTDAGFGGTLILGSTESNLETIGLRAFQGTGFTGDLTIPTSVTDIGVSAFLGINFEGDLTLNEGLLTIQSSAFESSSFTNGLTIPNSVTHIGSNAFKEATFAGPLELGTGLVTIEASIFYHATGFTGDLTIPGNITAIPNSMFESKSGSNNFNEGTLTLHDNLETIGLRAFRYTNFRGNLTIPDSVTEIGIGAFQGVGFDGNLTLETTESNLATIASWAFESNNFTGDLTIPASVTAIGGSAFLGIEFEGDLTLNEGLLTIQSSAFESSRFTNGLTIPNSVTHIGNSAFRYATFDGPLELGTGLVTIETSIFSWATGFTGDLTIPGNITAIPDNMFESNSGSNNFNEGTLTLHDSLETIGSSAFRSTNFRGDLTIPDSVTTIGIRAFQDVGFDGNLTLETTESNLATIASWAFKNNSFTGNLTIPETVISIGLRAFAGMEDLGSVTVNAPAPPEATGTPVEGKYDFFMGSLLDLGSGTIKVPEGRGPDYTDADGWNEYTIEEQE